MNMDDLYQEMKDALAFFGLRFSDKAKVAFRAHEGWIEFQHEGRSVSLRVDDTGVEGGEAP